MAYEYMVRFGQRVKTERIRQKWAPAELARRLGMSAETLFAIEAGTYPLTVVQANEIAKILKVPVGILM